MGVSKIETQAVEWGIKIDDVVRKGPLATILPAEGITRDRVEVGVGIVDDSGGSINQAPRIRVEVIKASGRRSINSGRYWLKRRFLVTARVQSEIQGRQDLHSRLGIVWAKNAQEASMQIPSLFARNGASLSAVGVRRQTSRF